MQNVASIFGLCVIVASHTLKITNNVKSVCGFFICIHNKSVKNPIFMLKILVHLVQLTFVKDLLLHFGPVECQGR